MNNHQTTVANNHQIIAAKNGFHWIIAYDSNGDITEREVRDANDLFTHFECTCGAKFDTKPDAISHLNEINTDESGEAVRHFSNGSGQ